MKEPWDNIKDKIRQEEAPLSENAWGDMSALLDQQKRSWASKQILWSVILLLAVLSPALYYWQYRSEPVHKLIEQNEATEQNTVNVKSSPEKQPESVTVSSITKKQEKKEIEGFAEVEKKGFQKKNIVSVEDDEPAAEDGNILGFENESLLSLPGKWLDAKGIVNMGSYIASPDYDFEKSKKPEKRRRKLLTNAEVRLFVAGTFNMANMSYKDGGASMNRNYLNAVEDGIKGGLGYDAGIEGSFALLEHLRISLGVGFREIVTQNNYSFEVDDIPVIDSATGNILAYIDRDKPMQVSDYSKNTYTYFNVPLSLRYDWPINYRWSITAEAIHNFSFLINGNETVINAGSLQTESGNSQSFAKTVNAYQLRLGLRYALTRNMDLALEPSYRSYYQDFYTEGPVSWKPSDFSISFSAIIKLK